MCLEARYEKALKYFRDVVKIGNWTEVSKVVGIKTGLFKERRDDS